MELKCLVASSYHFKPYFRLGKLNFRLYFNHIISASCAPPTNFLPSVCFPPIIHMTQRTSLLRTSIYSKLNCVSLPQLSRAEARNHVMRVHKTSQSGKKIKEQILLSIHFTIFVLREYICAFKNETHFIFLDFP